MVKIMIDQLMYKYLIFRYFQTNPYGDIYIYYDYIEFSVDVLDRIIWWILNSVTLYQ